MNTTFDNWIDNFPVLASMMFYSMDNKHATAAGIRYELDAPIDFALMEKAYEAAVKRFPYFHVRIARKDGSIYRQWSEEFPKIAQDPVDYLINAQDNCGYLYRISVCENYLTFQMFHGLTDGEGIRQFVKLILKNYYELLGEDVTIPEDAFPLEGSPEMGEYADPLKAEVFENAARNKREKARFFHIPVEKQETLHISYFSCDGNAFMNYAKSTDGSPYATTMILLAKSIAKLHKKAQHKGIRLSATINGKKIVGLVSNMMPMLQPSDFVFDDKTLAMENELLHTCVRGKIIADSFEDKLIPKLAAPKTLETLFSYMPSYEAKALLSGISINRVSNTASVSYAGKCNMGSLEKHIRSLYSFGESATPLLEINFANDRFYFCLSSKFDSSIYLETMNSIMREMGIECSSVEELSYQEGNGKRSELPKFGFNRATLEMVNAIGKLKK